MSNYSQTIRPDPNCPICHGSGEVYDSVPVPFGSGDCLMPSYCTCVEAQADDDDDGPDPDQIREAAAWELCNTSHDNLPWHGGELPASVQWAMKRRAM